MPQPLYLTFDGPILDQGVAQLMQIIQQSVQQGVDHLYIMISSPGGSVNAGITLYNFLKALPIKITTHNIGQVDSIANVVFMAGSERLATPGASFLLHGVTLDFNQGARMSRASLDEALSMVRQDEKRIATIMQDGTKLSIAQLTRFFRTGRSLGPAEAIRFGIATATAPASIPGDAQHAVVNAFPVTSPTFFSPAAIDW